METLRSYGGEEGDARIARRRAALIDAALALLGADDGGAISVRGVCRQAGLTARYFYESFASVDDLVADTFDEVIREISDAGLAAFDHGADVEQKVALAVGAIVDVIDADRRKGRLLFSQSLLSPTVAAKRMESTELFASLTLQTASGVLDVETGPDALAAAHFQVGGLGRVLAAWLDGHLDLDRDSVVSVSVGLMVSLGEGLSRAHASRADESEGR
nr:TetR/AcrR family transcriptional regulator [Gordonia soli]